MRRSPCLVPLLSLAALACAAPPTQSQQPQTGAVTAAVYVQGAAAIPQTSQSVVTVAFPQAQGAGHLNVVFVGWNDTSASVTSLTDARGNAYQLAVGPTRRSGCCSQSLYYSPGVAAGANTVTVRFNSAARFVDVRVLEYAGLEIAAPLDVAVGGAGSNASSASGSVLTRNANDLLVAGNVVGSSTTGPGTGYAQRILTAPDGDIAEDRVVTAVGSYAATAPLSAASGWVMQVAAFKIAGAPPPPPPPDAGPGDSSATTGAGGSTDGGTTTGAGGSGAGGTTGAGGAGGNADAGAGGSGGAPGAGGAAGASPFPVAYAPGGRYLQDRNGAPFPILGRSLWYIISLPVADYQTAIGDTVARGNNVVEVNTLDHDLRGNTPPFNGRGDAPFMRRLDGGVWAGSIAYSNINSEAPDFTTPNEPYWTFLDGFLSYCESRGVLVFMFPAYVGYGGGNQGWLQEMVANGPARMQAYGAWIANRYRNQTNLVWMMGGDMGTGSVTFNQQQTDVERALLTGLRSVAGQQSVQFSAEWNSESIASDQTDFGSAMTLNGAYSFAGDVSTHGRRAYAHTPAMPAYLLEEPYDEEGPDGNGVNPSATQPVRRFQWAGWLSTIGGYISGNGYLWPFGSTWRSHLDTQGSRDNARLNDFVRSIAWSELVPSGLGGMKTLITAGGGSSSSAGYVPAAATPAGTLLVAYVPPAHTGSITVDLTAMSGTARARWFNPTTAAYTTIGTFPNTGVQTFTPPGNNGSGFADWVLVVN